MKKLILPVLYFILPVLLSGCGYSSRSTLPSNIKTIHVAPVKNSVDFTRDARRTIYLPLLEVDVRNAVINRFIFDGSLKIAEPEVADLILKGDLQGYERSGLRFSDNDDVEEYRVHVTVSFELYDTANEETDWAESGFVGEATFFVSGPNISSEEAAIDRAVLDLARRIVERTVQDW